MEDVQERIRKYFPQLTNQQKLAAKFILEEPKEVALHPAKVVGALSGTSETTIIRLCYALSYSGYSELQNELRRTLIDRPPQEQTLSHFRFAAEELEGQEDLIAFHMEQDFATIQQTLTDLGNEKLARAVEAILDAKQIVVVGFRSSHAPAHWLAFALNIVKGNVHLYNGPIDDANYLLTQLNSSCLVIAFSFPRYVNETIQFAQAAKEKGAVVLGITDNELSPLGPIADQLLKVTTPAPTVLVGMAALFSLLNTLVSGVVAANREQVQERLDHYEKTSRQIYPFVRHTEEKG
ncbi:MurR/RpiR family transcriptional regulator [Brevibacillus choshinensis]|uniref:MurR/RpiR family transcriptional regulator n=1 Tax=Brevibacillus choshinensis TaxID=54911 RepID=UPI002E1FF1E3|nr:MurR/RpiR family transcriptional regulator [Brevibacillus choshinensis]MED4781285.1 MurR/RpiR family transcriptional regulator [Brevibacillus choshinensis]